MTVDRQTARLLVTCPDHEGLIARVAGFIAEHGGNILEADQHTDPDHGEFFMRVEIELGQFRLDRSSFESAWRDTASECGLRWHMYWGNEVKRMAILASREAHCLSDLLWRWHAGEFHVEVPFVAGNHEEMATWCEPYRVPFHHMPVTPETKPQQEDALRKLIDEHQIDFLVLARYMQILSPAFVEDYKERIINIHHSFLPAFAGPRPYHHAYERGVKLIGATSHYVTSDLDQGPIIAQSTMEVGHRDTVADMVRKGRDLERVVLARAVRLHIEDKILVSRNRTVVFD
ncbi:MAG: formyltetrahydrofolate deformylase [Phycisphaerae bacterium]